MQSPRQRRPKNPLATADIPVISDESPREDLIRYIRLLEQRLEVDHVFIGDPDNPDPDHWLGLRRHELTQQERVDALKSGFDAVTVREIGEHFREESMRIADREHVILRRRLNRALAANRRRR